MPAQSRTSHARWAPGRSSSTSQGVFAWNQDAITDNAHPRQGPLSKPRLPVRGPGRRGRQPGSRSGQARRHRLHRSDRRRGERVHGLGGRFQAEGPHAQDHGMHLLRQPRRRARKRERRRSRASGFRPWWKRASPIEGANTITFTSRDGYQVALPLQYVLQRYSLIVTTVNGEAAADAVGCANQLWLGGTSARSFARDVVSISITRETEPPAAPGSGTGAAPNVGIMEGATEA